MTAPIGCEVGLYVDLIAHVEVGDVIETRSGRRYGVLSVRVQERGKHKGRQHLRALVVEPEFVCGGRVHRIRWYHRGRSSGGVLPRGRS